MLATLMSEVYMMDSGPKSAIPIGMPRFPVLPMTLAIVTIERSFVSLKKSFAKVKLITIQKILIPI